MRAEHTEIEVLDGDEDGAKEASAELSSLVVATDVATSRPQRVDKRTLAQQSFREYKTPRLKNVDAMQRIMEFPREPFRVLGSERIMCDACNRALGIKKSVIISHIRSDFHRAKAIRLAHSSLVRAQNLGQQQASNGERLQLSQSRVISESVRRVSTAQVPSSSPAMPMLTEDVPEQTAANGASVSDRMSLFEELVRSGMYLGDLEERTIKRRLLLRAAGYDDGSSPPPLRSLVEDSIQRQLENVSTLISGCMVSISLDDGWPNADVLSVVVQSISENWKRSTRLVRYTCPDAETTYSSELVETLSKSLRISKDDIIGVTHSLSPLCVETVRVMSEVWPNVTQIACASCILLESVKLLKLSKASNLLFSFISVLSSYPRIMDEFFARFGYKPPHAPLSNRRRALTEFALADILLEKQKEVQAFVREHKDVFEGKTSVTLLALKSCNMLYTEIVVLSELGHLIVEPLKKFSNPKVTILDVADIMRSISEVAAETVPASSVHVEEERYAADHANICSATCRRYLRTGMWKKHKQTMELFKAASILNPSKVMGTVDFAPLEGFKFLKNDKALKESAKSELYEYALLVSSYDEVKPTGGRYPDCGDVLEFWKLRVKHSPALASIVQKMCCVKAVCCSCEREGPPQNSNGYDDPREEELFMILNSF